MALPSTGAISLTDVQTEFGGSNPASLSEYYAGGAYVPAGTTGTNGAVPSSGAIDLNVFHGTSAGFTYWIQTQSSNTGFSHAAVGFDASDNYYSAMNGSANAPTFNKVASLGANQFTRRFTSGYYTRMATAESSGNSYIVGQQSTNIFVVKYNSSGVLQWQKTLSPTSGNFQPIDICVDPSENVYVMGLSSTGSVTEIVSLSSAGALRWNRTLTPASTPGELFGGLCYYDTGASQGVGGYFLVGTGSGGVNNLFAFTYGLTGTYNGAASLASPTRSLASSYMGLAWANPYFLFGFQVYDNAFTTTYQQYVTFSGTITWQKELSGTNPSLDQVSSDGANFYGAGLNNSAVVITKFTSTGTLSSQRRVASMSNAAGGCGVTASTSGQLAFGEGGGVSNPSYFAKGPQSMAFGTSAGMTSTTANWVAGTVGFSDGAGTIAVSAGAYTEASFSGTYSLAQLT